LAGTIRELMGDVNRLTEIESNARRIAILDAETRIANLIEAAVERRSG
jgi:UDP-N-acetylglucosamine:LPS N-acetylglucosamine transferase